MTNPKRVRVIHPVEPGGGPVLYVMARDQRVADNWALLYAQELAMERQQPLLVACPVAADYPDAPRRQVAFMLSGLRRVEGDLAKRRIPFAATTGSTVSGLRSLIKAVSAGAVVADFNPLKASRRWKAELADVINIPFFEVDAHNIVPCREASNKPEYAAYTIRPRLNKKLAEFLTSFPRLLTHPFASEEIRLPRGWSGLADLPGAATQPGGRRFGEPGEAAALKQLRRFLARRLTGYRERRNNPVENGQSDLSPYLHFGQLSAQRVALEAQRYDGDIASQEAFLEELIVRRELADNFCYYNDRYDSIAGFPAWARTTLDDHRSDPRPYLYDRKRLEAGATHDELWNAAQAEMVVTGKMHGYLRMYWAKKILEWTASPEEAMAHAIYLNNKYELDGHDPNGYAGIAWSIGGVHDRAWSERDIFGKVRYMSYGGCKRKFPVADYIDRVAALSSEAAA